MAVITISRQLGSHGRDIGRIVSERLGYRFVWREMINEAARRASTPEVALAMIDELDLLGLNPTSRAQKEYCRAVEQVMQELGQKGDVVILGRAGQVVLHDYPSALHVRVIAPEELRSQRISAEQNVTVSAAQAQVEASDRSRRQYLEKYYGAKWDDPELYDLVINTAHITTPQAIELVCSLVNQRVEPAQGRSDEAGAHT
jgi:cytidylate kinase